MEIKLAGGRVAIIDEDSYPLLSKHKWWTRRDACGSFYARTKISGKGIEMHRLLISCPTGMVVDHINCNPLDNRKENLRIATSQQNCANRRRAKNNTTGYKGVHFRKDRNRYLVKLTFNGNRMYIGMFLTLEEAKEAYSKAALKWNGEFARAE